MGFLHQYRGIPLLPHCCGVDAEQLDAVGEAGEEAANVADAVNDVVLQRLVVLEFLKHVIRILKQVVIRLVAAVDADVVVVGAEEGIPWEASYRISDLTAGQRDVRARLKQPEDCQDGSPLSCRGRCPERAPPLAARSLWLPVARDVWIYTGLLGSRLRYQTQEISLC